MKKRIGKIRRNVEKVVCKKYFYFQRIAGRIRFAGNLKMRAWKLAQILIN